MYSSQTARELAVLLRISRDLDIVGDVSATVENPAELLAWANALDNPQILAWRAKDSGHRYLNATATHAKAPVRGQLNAVLPGEQHRDFWNALGLEDLAPGDQRDLTLDRLADAWATTPLEPPTTESA